MAPKRNRGGSLTTWLALLPHNYHLVMRRFKIAFFNAVLPLCITYLSRDSCRNLICKNLGKNGTCLVSSPDSDRSCVSVCTVHCFNFGCGHCRGYGSGFRGVVNVGSVSAILWKLTPVCGVDICQTVTETTLRCHPPCRPAVLCRLQLCPVSWSPNTLCSRQLILDGHSVHVGLRHVRHNRSNAMK